MTNRIKTVLARLYRLAFRLMASNPIVAIPSDFVIGLICSIPSALIELINKPMGTIIGIIYLVPFSIAAIIAQAVWINADLTASMKRASFKEHK